MALSYILLFLCFAHIYPIFAVQRAICSSKNEVIAELEKRYNLEISDANLAIKYDFDDTHVADLTYESVDLLLNTANIIFKGFIKSKSSTGDNERTSINFDSKPILVRRDQLGRDVQHNCTLVSSQNFEISMGLPEDTEAVIIELTERCLQKHVCEKFESIVTNVFLQKQRFEKIYEAPRPTSKPDNHAYAHVGNNPTCTAHHDATYNPQSTINAMTDFGINVLINKIATSDDGIVKIPDVHYETSMGATFEINAYNGTFKDLKTLNRVKDVVFTHNNLKFNVGSTFRLEKAEINFDYYKIRYGKVYVDGYLHVLVNGITLAMNVSLDYNEKPCHTYLTELAIGEIGNIDVNLTGFGLLNKPVEMLSRWVIKKKTFEAVKEALTAKLKDLDCEQYRPYAKGL